MDVTPIECDGAEELPFFKEEPRDDQLKFLYSNEKVKEEESSQNNEHEEQSVESFIQDSFLYPISSSEQNEIIDFSNNGTKNDDNGSVTLALDSLTNSCNFHCASKISEAVIIVNNNETHTQSCESTDETLFQAIEKDPESNSFSLNKSLMNCASKSETKEKVNGSKPNSDTAFNLSQAGDAIANLAVDKLPPNKQLSGKTDEVCIEMGEDLVKDKSSRTSTNSNKKTNSHKVSPAQKEKNKNVSLLSEESDSCITKLSTTENSTSSTNPALKSTTKTRGKRGRPRKIKLTPEKGVGAGDELNNHDKTNEINHKGSSNPETQEEITAEFDAVRSKTMQRKVGERKMSMQTRSSVKQRACKFQIGLQRAVLQGLGIRMFNCAICTNSFTQKVLLKKHIAEAHEGRLDFNEDEVRVPKDLCYICPLCPSTYARKYGVKRHFARKHPNIKRMFCPECKYKSNSLTDYLKHTEIHQAVELNAPHLTLQKCEGSQLKCRECHRIFQSSDALRLHVLNHNMLITLAQTDSCFSTLPQDDVLNCTCILNDSKSSTSGSDCLVHSSHLSANDVKDLCQTINLQPDLMSTVQHSIETVSKVTSRMDSMIRSFSTRSLSPRLVEKLFQALNCVSSLSSGLTGLASFLGKTLLTEVEESNGGGGENVTEIKGDIMNDVKVVLKDIRFASVPPEVELEEVGEEEVDEEEVGEEVVEDDTTICEVKKKRVSSATPHKVKSKQPLKRGRKKIMRKRKVCKTEDPHDHECAQCGKTYKNCRSLRRHALLHTGHRPYRCKVCKLTFYRKDHLKRHMMVHTEDRPFKCEDCSYSFKTARALHMHSLLHGQDRSFPCEKCNYIGRSIYELTKHEKKHKPCPLCSYEPADNADYRLHKRSHFSFACVECNYACFSRFQLKRHTMCHRKANGDRPMISCNLCDYTCFDRRQFDYHMARHKNKTPFSCPDCDYKCSSRTSFAAHKLKHAGLKPYLCSICGASFRRTSYLNNHMLIHKDEKKHLCSVCSRPFRSRYNLKVHEMIHTGEKQFKCHLCHFACRRRKELRLHLEKHALLDDDDNDVKPSLPKIQDNEVAS